VCFTLWLLTFSSFLISINDEFFNDIAALRHILAGVLTSTIAIVVYTILSIELDTEKVRYIVS